MENTNPLNEHAFQRLIIDHLVKDDHYGERDAKTDYDADLAMDCKVLLAFLHTTQPQKMETVGRLYGARADETVIGKIGLDIANRGLLDCPWDGVELDGVTLDLIYPKPPARFDKQLNDLFEKNRLTVMEEVYHKPGERIDLVVFLNGLALFTFELKCPTSATRWTYLDAIEQYQKERDCTTRLLRPKVGALAHFAMDLNEVHCCAQLKGRESSILPFNMGNNADGGDVHNTGSGNPPNPNGGLSVSYMWEDTLTWGTVFSLIEGFCYVATGEKDVGRRKIKTETPIFPRYHQLRAVRRVEADMAANGTLRNYLIEHSAGSGKTNTIAWLAHGLAGLYGEGEASPLLDKVLVVTDRIVVDRQLQHAITDMERVPGVVAIMDKGKKSDDLCLTLRSKNRIVVTTIQKFLHLPGGTLAKDGRRFAVIIDEAHGSTSGKSMQSVNVALASGEDVLTDGFADEMEEYLRSEISLGGRQRNVSLIGFTATPKPATLQLFGTTNTSGQKEAFDLYTMRQAIEERFILDVLDNYTTYDVFCRIEKAVADDPELESVAAKRKIIRYIDIQDDNLTEKLAVSMRHFASQVMPTLGGHAKAMVVSPSRTAAVKYRLLFDALAGQAGGAFAGMKALVAFTGEVELDGVAYTEASMNGFADDEELRRRFDSDEYQVLIVADKYQTGFDQSKLCAMYIDKKLHGVAAVQTLSRLNRVCPPYDKRTFVLDFKNSFEDIQKSFEPYYETTLLTDPLTFDDVRRTEREMLGFRFLEEPVVIEYNTILSHPRRTNADKERMWGLIDVSARKVRARTDEEQDKIRRVTRSFIRQYGFMLQAVSFENTHLHAEYNYCVPLIRELEGHGGGISFDIDDKVSAKDFRIEKSGEHVGEKVEAKPELAFPKGTGSALKPDQLERLSKIIEDINARYGKHFDTTVAAGSVMALQKILSENPKVRQSAKANSITDFRTTAEGCATEALVNSYEQNEEWYGFLLNNDEVRRQLMHAFVDDIYHGIREE